MIARIHPKIGSEQEFFFFVTSKSRVRMLTVADFAAGWIGGEFAINLRRIFRITLRNRAVKITNKHFITRIPLFTHKKIKWSIFVRLRVGTAGVTVV